MALSGRSQLRFKGGVSQLAAHYIHKQRTMTAAGGIALILRSISCAELCASHKEAGTMPTHWHACTAYQLNFHDAKSPAK